MYKTAENLFLLFVGIIFTSAICYKGIYLMDSGKAAITERKDEIAYLEMLPDNLNNFRHEQPSTFQLHQICKSGRINRIIRMNGGGDDSGGVSIGEEKAICQKYGVDFLFVNAHLPESADKIHNYLMFGNTLIHCKHGYDRTGAMVGYHLRKQGFSRPYVLKFNRWENYLERKGKAYEKYFKLIQ